MEYSFRISENEYLEVLKSELRKKRADPLSMIFVFLCTLVQFSFSIWLIASGYVSGGLAVSLGLLSVLLLAAMLFYQFAITQQAKAEMKKCWDAGYLYQDMGSLIRLKIKNGVLYVSGGENKLSYDCGYFVEYGFIDDVLALYFSNGRMLHRLLIPVSAFSDRDAAAAFGDTVSRLGREGRKGEPDEEIIAEVHYTSSEKEFTDGFLSCSRTAYRTGYALNSTFILKAAFSALLIWYVIKGTFESSAWDAVAVAGAVFMLYRPLAVFSPLMRLSAKNYARSLFAGRPGMDFTVTVSENILNYKADSFCNNFAVQSVVCVEKTKSRLYIYLNGGVMLFIPVTADNSAAVSRCYIFLSGIADRNRKAKGGLFRQK